jgi:hypothetical protein
MLAGDAQPVEPNQTNERSGRQVTMQMESRSVCRTDPEQVDWFPQGWVMRERSPAATPPAGELHLWPEPGLQTGFGCRDLGCRNRTKTRGFVFLHRDFSNLDTQAG